MSNISGFDGKILELEDEIERLRDELIERNAQLLHANDEIEWLRKVAEVARVVASLDWDTCEPCFAGDSWQKVRCRCPKCRLADALRGTEDS